MEDQPDVFSPAAYAPAKVSKISESCTIISKLVKTSKLLSFIGISSPTSRPTRANRSVNLDMARLDTKASKGDREKDMTAAQRQTADTRRAPNGMIIRRRLALKAQAMFYRDYTVGTIRASPISTVHSLNG